MSEEHPGGGPPPSGPESEPPSAQRYDPQPPPTPPYPGIQPRLPAPSPHARVVLRPMGIGELLDTAINLYRVAWKTLIGLVALVLVPFNFIQQFVSWRVSRPYEPTTAPDIAGGEIAAMVILGAAGFLVITPFITAAVARAASEVYLGYEPSIGDTARFAGRRAHSILWVTLIATIAIVLGLVALVVPAVIFYVRFLFGSAVVVIEGKKGGKALGRSWELAKGSFWKILGTMLLTLLITLIVGAILQIPTELAGVFIGPAGWIVVAIGSSVAAVISAPLTTIIAVLLYFDMRIRKEGFDLALMAQEITRGTREA